METRFLVFPSGTCKWGDLPPEVSKTLGAREAPETSKMRLFTCSLQNWKSFPIVLLKLKKLIVSMSYDYEIGFTLRLA